MKWKITILSFSAAIVALAILTSCCNSTRLQRKHTNEVKAFNEQISGLNSELQRQTAMLDSLQGLPAKVDTVIRHTERIIDNTDSLVIINNRMLQMLHGISFDTDTIKRILRNEKFNDIF